MSSHSASQPLKGTRINPEGFQSQPGRPDPKFLVTRAEADTGACIFTVLMGAAGCWPGEHAWSDPESLITKSEAVLGVYIFTTFMGAVGC